MAHELTRPPSRATSHRDARMSGRMRSDTFERLHEEHAKRLSSFLLYRTGNQALAEDLLADTWERVLRSRHRFDPRRGSERRWLYTIALNLLRDHARRQTNEERVLRDANAGSTPEVSDPGLAAVEHRDELYRALAVLNDSEREALALRFGSDLKLRDVAKVLGESESAVEGRIYRALGRLRENLD